MAKEYVRQHIVPKRYLDRFASGKAGKEQIGTRYCADNGSAPVFFPKRTDEVGYIKNFYDVTDKDDPKYWEHYFADNIDTLCGKPLEHIIQTTNLSYDGAVVLTKADRTALSKLIVAQMLRIPSSVEYVQGELYDRISRTVKQRILDAFPPLISKAIENRVWSIDISQQELKEFYFNQSFSAEKFEYYCSIMDNRTYVVYYNKRWKTEPFITSDNPVVINSLSKSEIGVFRCGISDPCTCIFFPISPAIAVASYSRQGIITGSAASLDNQMVVIDEHRWVINMNYKQMMQAYQYVFLPQPLYDEFAVPSSDKKKRPNKHP